MACSPCTYISSILGAALWIWMSNIGECVWTLGLLLAALFGNIVKSLLGGGSLEKMAHWGGPWGYIPWPGFLSILSLSKDRYDHPVFCSSIVPSLHNKLHLPEPISQNRPFPLSSLMSLLPWRNTMSNAAWGGKGVFVLHFPSMVHQWSKWEAEPKQGKNLEEELLQRSQRSAAYGFALYGLLSQLSYRIQVHQPSDLTNHNGLSPPLSITLEKMPCRLAYSLLLRRNFLNCGFLLYELLSPVSNWPELIQYFPLLPLSAHFNTANGRVTVTLANSSHKDTCLILLQPQGRDKPYLTNTAARTLKPSPIPLLTCSNFLSFQVQENCRLFAQRWAL